MRVAASAVEANTLAGMVSSVQWQGDVHSITVQTGGESLRMSAPPMADPPDIGDAILVRLDPAHVTLLPEEGGGV